MNITFTIVSHPLGEEELRSIAGAVRFWRDGAGEASMELLDAFLWRHSRNFCASSGGAMGVLKAWVMATWYGVSRLRTLHASRQKKRQEVIVRKISYTGSEK
jgi:hypothetical protein